MRILKKLSCATLLLGLLGSVGCVPTGSSDSRSTGEPELTAEEKKAKLVNDNAAYVIANGQLPDGPDGKMLEGANLSGKNIRLSSNSFHNFNEVNLKGANLQEAQLNHIQLKKADLSNAQLNNTKLTQANFTEAIMIKAELKDVTSYQSLFNDANLTEAQFDNSDLTSSDFRQANLTNASFKNTNLHDCFFQNATISGADFTGAYKQRVLGNTTFAKEPVTKLEDLNSAKKLIFDPLNPPIFSNP